MSLNSSYSKKYINKLFLLLLVFIGTGLALSFSISYSYSILHGRVIGIEGSAQGVGIFKLFFKQLIATILGIGGVLYLLKIPTGVLKKLSNIAIIIFGLTMIYTSFFGPEINGSRRWIVIAGTSIQTGDFARLSLIIYLANIFSYYHKIFMHERDAQKIKEARKYVTVRFLISTLVYTGSLYLQHDYSSLLISAMVIIAIVLISDFPYKLKFGGMFVGLCLFVFIILSNPNRMDRILNYLQPGIDPLGTEFQIQQSYELIKQGGLLGAGVGSNMLEVLGLPYFNNDFVFSIIVGEYGLMGALLVLVFYTLMCWYSFNIGKKLYKIDRFYYFMLLAATINIIVSAVAHIAVTIGIAPTAGLNLPFYSSGGSSMITSIWSYGLILRAAVALYYYENNQDVFIGATSSSAQMYNNMRMI